MMAQWLSASANDRDRTADPQRPRPDDSDGPAAPPQRRARRARGLSRSLGARAGRATAGTAPAPGRRGRRPEPRPRRTGVGRAEPAHLPPRRRARGLWPGAARGAARRRPGLSLERRLAPSGAALGPDLDHLEVAPEIAARLRAMLARPRGLAVTPLPPHARRAAGDLGGRAPRGCSTTARRPRRRDPAGPPVLVVPSLINRAYVLDLGPGRPRCAGWPRGPAAGAARLGDAWHGGGRFDLDDYGARPPGAGAARGAGGGRRGRWRCSATAWAARSPRGSRRARRTGSRRWRRSARPGTSPRPAASPAASAR